MHDAVIHRDSRFAVGATPRVGRGGITLLLGCMFSGKTTELLRRLRAYPQDTILAVKHLVDTRYNAAQIVSHGGQAWEAQVAPSARAIPTWVSPRTRVVAIDEAHFFDDGLPDLVLHLAAQGLDVIVTSLEPDSWGRPFLPNGRLCGVADHRIMKYAACARCRAVADRTQRLTPIVDGNMIVDPDNYEPRCRVCWRPPPEPPTCQLDFAGLRISTS
jgi:thymidine kinase